MILRAHAISFLTLAFAGVLLMLSTVSANASAESYGELGRFGRKGEGPGEFIVPESIHAFGVDAEDESVAGHTSLFVAGEADSGKEYRIQKIRPKVNGEGKLEGDEFLASRSIPSANSTGLEGIAVDPVLKRIYVLAVAKRSYANKFDPGTTAAATLYAFSTETLAPAPETKEENGVAGVLAGPAELHAQSDTAKEVRQMLLAPRGIAVDPSTHDVIILGQQDDQEKLDKGEEVEPILRAALQRVRPNGELAGRYVDTTDCFGFGEEEPGKPPVCEGLEEEEESPGEAPASPVVSQAGRVYVETYDRIWEIPTMVGTKSETEFGVGPPKLFFKIGSLDNVLQLASLRRGGGLSFVHEQGAPDGEATLYAYGRIKLGEATGTSRGVLEFKYIEHEGGATLSELGWTGGQTPASAKGKCALAIEGEPSIAGATKGDVFVFDPDPPPFGEELTVEADPHVTGFGPGGSGCPSASATTPSVTVEGVTAEGAVSVGKSVTLSSEVGQANALNVEWRFENLTTHEAETTPLSGEEYQTTKVEHTFGIGGEYKVTEVIHTDDLAEPRLEEMTTLVVNGNALEPIARFNYPTLAVTNESATFKAHVSDPNGNGALPFEYVWKFGDGSSAIVGKTSAAAFSESHIYQQPGRYTVTLAVTDKLGRMTEESHEVLVQTAQEEHKEETGGGGDAGGGQNTEGGGTASSGQTASSVQTGGGVSVQATHDPDATLASTSLTASSSGAFTVRVACPSGETGCSGTVTLHTLGAVDIGASTSAKRKTKKVVLTLAVGSFAVAGGQVKEITLHLSAQARKLLTHSHVLRVRAIVLAHDPAGAMHIAQTIVTLRGAKPSHRH